MLDSQLWRVVQERLLPAGANVSDIVDLIDAAPPGQVDPCAVRLIQ